MFTFKSTEGGNITRWDSCSSSSFYTTQALVVQVRRKVSIKYWGLCRGEGSPDVLVFSARMAELGTKIHWESGVKFHWHEMKPKLRRHNLQSPNTKSDNKTIITASILWLVQAFLSRAEQLTPTSAALFSLTCSEAGKSLAEAKTELKKHTAHNPLQQLQTCTHLGEHRWE